MKKSIKTCCCLGLALFLALSGAREVNAADGHCGTVKVACGSPVANVPVESHLVYVAGKPVTCQKTKEMHLHTISCTGCGECCRHLDRAAVYAVLDRGDVTCKYLVGDACAVYPFRPLLFLGL